MKNRSMGRSFLTSSSIISPLGWNTGENFRNIIAGKTGIEIYENSPWSKEAVPLSVMKDGEVDERFSDLGSAPAYTKLEKMALLSMAEALEGSKVDPSSSSTVLIVSTTKGNVHLLDDEDNFDKQRVYLWNTADLLAGFFKMRNRPLLVCNACISGVAAILLGKRLISSGKFRNAIIVGMDILSRFIVSGFQSFLSLSAEACRPFDEDRSGLSLGEAAATVVLSEKESDIEILSGSLSNDANHISGPSRTGEGLFLSVSKTLEEIKAELGPEPSDWLDLISAHGTATLYNDEMESIALTRAGLNNVPVNSLKGNFGHTLGAAGLVESVINTEAMRRDEMPGTKGFSKLGVSRPLDVISNPRRAEVKIMLKLASGFGGCNASILYRKN